MRPLRQRICVVVWIVCLLFSIAATATLASPYVGAQVEVFPKPGAATNVERVTLPPSIVDAYNTGKMSHQEQHEFEVDVRNGVVAVPIGKRVAFAPRYPSLGNTASNLLVFLLLPAFAAAILQYLLAGFANPMHLFRNGPQSR